MTTKTKFYVAIAIAIVMLVVFAITTFTHILKETEGLNFLQGFSGGLGFGSVLAAIIHGTLRKEKRESIVS